MNGFNSPAEVARSYVTIGTGKVNLRFMNMFVLAIMAGAFIALGGAGATTAAVNISSASLGKFIGACIFPGGLAMVMVAGGELFTGNCLLIIPLLERTVRFGGVVRNLIIVYLGNMVGGLLVAAGLVFSHQLSLFNNGMAVSVLSIAAQKTTITFQDSLIKGILCNVLVCLGVWMAIAGKDIAGKIIGLFFPVMIFVLCGFEHCVANMYYVGAGLFAKLVPEYAQAAIDAGVSLDSINSFNFVFTCLLPSTIGNIIGGALVGLVYWAAYLKGRKES